jgi:hypothetical protein
MKKYLRHTNILKILQLNLHIVSKVKLKITHSLYRSRQPLRVSRNLRVPDFMIIGT